MKKILTILFVFLSLATTSCLANKHDDGTIKISDLNAQRSGSNCLVSMQLILDSLHIRSNHQLFVTPYIESGDGKECVQLPSMLFSGRNMHYVYLRSGETKATGKTNYDVRKEIYHKGGAATVNYAEATPLQSWMLNNDARLTVNIDTCGCGDLNGSSQHEPQLLSLNPVTRMITMPYPTPNVSGKGRIISHNGRARVQFEVNRIELHEQPYVCKSGQRIDNRKELKVIDDSIHYALNDPNVEIESITICGYASPETPYEHNNYLATNRSRALTEYIERKYQLPHERCTYTAVTENWAEFREQVIAAKDITEQQRKDLLELIDRPANSPAEYDQKEKELKTLPKFAKLYAQKILPVWFPHLRATSFTINTQLKPMSDIQLRDVMAKTPSLMSLDEIYRVATTYKHGSDEWQKAMAVALQEFPEDPTANCNAAALAIEQHDYSKAEKYLSKAGESEEANILRGIIYTNKGDYDKAREYFNKAGNTPEAQRNLRLIQNN